jgi:hypothetical protein
MTRDVTRSYPKEDAKNGSREAEGRPETGHKVSTRNTEWRG